VKKKYFKVGHGLYDHFWAADSRSIRLRAGLEIKVDNG